MIDKIREIVKKESSERDWKYHIYLVVKYAKQLARAEKVDEELAELGALLHDIGRIRHGGKDHEITGISEAKKILKQLKYPEEVIEEIKHCVENHRASKKHAANTKLALIIRDADALAHFDSIPILIQAGLEKFEGDIEQTVRLVNAKIDRDWKNKMHLPESKRIGEEKYKAAKLLLKSTTSP